MTTIAWTILAIQIVYTLCMILRTYKVYGMKAYIRLNLPFFLLLTFAIFLVTFVGITFP